MTFDLSQVALIGLCYLLLLFGIAYITERGWIPEAVTSHPITYILSLGIFASAWAFYGVIDLAFQYGYGALAYYLGTGLLFLFAPVALAPLAELQEVERLSLHTVRVDDGSLAPLAAMKKLRWLTLANVFPMEQVARLAGRRPDIECALFTASQGPVVSVACRKCRQHTLHMTTGKGVPWLCAGCDGARLAKHVAAFETLRAGAGAA